MVKISRLVSYCRNKHFKGVGALEASGNRTDTDRNMREGSLVTEFLPTWVRGCLWSISGDTVTKNIAVITEKTK